MKHTVTQKIKNHNKRNTEQGARSRPAHNRPTKRGREYLQSAAKSEGYGVPVPHDDVPMRVQKLLSQHGYGSRRELDAALAAGEIKIDGRIAAPGDLASARNKIYIGERKVVFRPALVQETASLLLYHKPQLEICSRKDEKKRRVVFDALPPFAKQWHMVGRLDYTTTGLLLFTNDGTLANFLMHPRYQHKRVYMVRALGVPPLGYSEKMQKGIFVDGEKLRATAVQALGERDEDAPANRWYQVTMHSGQNRAVRRLFEACDMEVSRLKRTAFHTVELPKNLLPGRTRLLEQAHIDALVKACKKQMAAALP